MKTIEKKLFQSKLSLKSLFLTIFLIVFFSFLLYLFLINIQKYDLNWNILLEILPFFFLGSLVKELIMLSRVIFYEDSMEVIDFLGFRKRKLDYHLIKFWTTKQKRSKKGFNKRHWEELLIEFYDGERVRLKSYNYTNYPKIYEQIMLFGNRYL